MRKFYLIGGHLSHSHSPSVHKKLGNRHYKLREVAPDELKDFFVKREFAGINVTIPYKQDVMPLCDCIDAEATKIGAVNTVVNCGGKLFGTNTDIDGFIMMCRKAKIDFFGKKVLILGSGGTSKTAFAAAKKLLAKEIRIVSRNGELNYKNAAKTANDTEIIVNTTPVGMFPDTDEQPIDLKDFPILSGVVDVIYNPLRTTLTLCAKEMGIPYANGLDMLVCQAAVADSLFNHRVHSYKSISATAAKLRRSLSSIVLIGMPGCGKSTAGKIISKMTGRTLIDTDSFIEKSEGMSIPEIFEKYGEAHFRMLETEVIRTFSNTGGAVIACGGGSILKRENRIALMKNGVVFYLERDMSRLARHGRPLSTDDAAIERIFRERRKIYEDTADVIIAETASPYKCALSVLNSFNNFDF